MFVTPQNSMEPAAVKPPMITERPPTSPPWPGTIFAPAAKLSLPSSSVSVSPGSGFMCSSCIAPPSLRSMTILPPERVSRYFTCDSISSAAMEYEYVPRAMVSVPLPRMRRESSEMSPSRESIASPERTMTASPDVGAATLAPPACQPASPQTTLSFAPSERIVPDVNVASNCPALSLATVTVVSPAPPPVIAPTSPDHPANACPEAGTAVSVTVSPRAIHAEVSPEAASSPNFTTPLSVSAE